MSANNIVANKSSVNIKDRAVFFDLIRKTRKTTGNIEYTILTVKLIPGKNEVVLKFVMVVVMLSKNATIPNIFIILFMY
jgi:hypothetical protein